MSPHGDGCRISYFTDLSYHYRATLYWICENPVLINGMMILLYTLIFHFSYQLTFIVIVIIMKALSHPFGVGFVNSFFALQLYLKPYFSNSTLHHVIHYHHESCPNHIGVDYIKYISQFLSIMAKSLDRLHFFISNLTIFIHVLFGQLLFLGRPWRCILHRQTYSLMLLLAYVG